MALDIELKIASSVLVDVSASATPAATPTFELSHQGFPTQACFIVHIEESVSVADNAIDPVKFFLDVTVDDEVSWHTVAVIDLEGDGAVTNKGIYSVPIGPMDFRAEMKPADVGSDSQIALRVRCTLGTTGSTDDFTYSAYLGSGNPYPHFSYLGVAQ